MPATPQRRASARRWLALAAGLLVLAAAALALAAGGEPAKPLAIGVEGGPAGLAIADGRVLVAAPRAGEVVVLDSATGERAGSPLHTGGAPVRVARAAAGLWVTDAAAGAVVPVQPPRVFAPVRAGADASDVVLAAGALWIASSADGRVYVLESGAAPRPLSAGRSPVALAADDRRVVATDDRDGTLTVFDARARRSLGAPLRIGGAPVDVALDGATAWVADAVGGRIVAVNIDTGTIERSIAVGRRPVALATAGEDVYAVTAGDRQLVRVRDGAVRSRRDLGAEPAALAVDPDHVWVTLPGSDQVLRFDR